MHKYLWSDDLCGNHFCHPSVPDNALLPGQVNYSSVPRQPCDQNLPSMSMPLHTGDPSGTYTPSRAHTYTHFMKEYRIKGEMHRKYNFVHTASLHIHTKRAYIKRHSTQWKLTMAYCTYTLKQRDGVSKHNVLLCILLSAHLEEEMISHEYSIPMPACLFNYEHLFIPKRLALGELNSVNTWLFPPCKSLFSLTDGASRHARLA